MVRKSWNLSWCHDMIWRGCGKNFTKFLKVITYDAYKPENMRIGFFISCVARIGFKHRTCQTFMKRWEFWSQSPHMISWYLVKFHNFLASFAFYKIKNNLTASLWSCFVKTIFWNFSPFPRIRCQHMLTTMNNNSALIIFHFSNDLQFNLNNPKKFN